MVYLYGASGHAKVVIEILELQQITVAGLVDDNPDIKKLLDYKVQLMTELQANQQPMEMILSIGNNIVRKKLAAQLTVQFIKAIHPDANISTRATLGHGTMVMAGATVNSEATIGEHVIVNTNSSVDHDCIIDNFAHIAPNASLAGNVFVGEGAHVGIGASVIQEIKIGKWSTIGAGAVITKDVPDYAVVVGNPGKIIKYNKIDEQ